MYINDEKKIANILTLGIFFERFLIIGFIYAKLEVIEVKQINNIENICIVVKKLKLVDMYPGSKLELLVDGAIKKPENVKKVKIPINTIVRKIRLFKAIFCVLNTTMLINNIEAKAIMILIEASAGNIRYITKAKAKDEKTTVPILAIQKKKPIMYAKNPPNPSLLKLYAPPETGKLIESSE